MTTGKKHWSICVAAAVILMVVLSGAELSAQGGLDALRQAAEQGNASMQSFLGAMYSTGWGVPEDDTEAARWYRRAADQGDASAQRRLGIMYLSGRGVPEDDTEAVRWFRRAADQGDADGQFGLGGMYASGLGVLKDPVLAHMWLNIAGANGNSEAPELRDRVEGQMTRDEISRATSLARECMASDYQDCEP